MNKDFLEKRIENLFKTKTKFAETLGISLPSLSEWFKREVIPSSRISEVFELLNIESKEDKDIALGRPQLKYSFRSTRDLIENEVPESILKNVNSFSKVYFSLGNFNDSSESLDALKKEIGKIRDHKKVARIIRNHLGIKDITPFDNNSLDYILKKFGIHTYIVPFKSFKFNTETEKLRALTANKCTQFLILCDSSRTHDEVMFDLTHEIVHVLTGLVGGKRCKEEENFIDLITEELIYPEAFLLREFPFLKEKSRVTPEKFLKHNFRELIRSYGFFAPKGVARALVSRGYLKENHKAFIWMHGEEHENFLKFFGKSLSDFGKMNIDFTDSYEFQNFIEGNVLSDIKKYPLFFDLMKGLIKGNITPRAFASIFDMDSGDVDELKKDLSVKIEGLLQAL